jgi:hypothetical protein
MGHDGAALVISGKIFEEDGSKHGIIRVAQVGQTVDGIVIRPGKFYTLNRKGKFVLAEDQSPWPVDPEIG